MVGFVALFIEQPRIVDFTCDCIFLIPESAAILVPTDSTLCMISIFLVYPVSIVAQAIGFHGDVIVRMSWVFDRLP